MSSTLPKPARAADKRYYIRPGQLYETFGIHYQPTTDDILEGYTGCRRVVVRHLPATTHLSRILDRVWGGRVISAFLADVPRAAAVVAGEKCALIEFARAEMADVFVRQASTTHRIGHRVAVAAAAASGGVAPVVDIEFAVSLAGTVSYPMPIAMRSHIKQGHSRYMTAARFNPNLIMQFLIDAQFHQPLHVEELLALSFDGQSTLHLQFNSIDSAARAFTVLATLPRYGYIGRAAANRTAAIAQASRGGDGGGSGEQKHLLTWGRDPCDHAAIADRGVRFDAVVQSMDMKNFMAQFCRMVAQMVVPVSPPFEELDADEREDGGLFMAPRELDAHQTILRYDDVAGTRRWKVPGGWLMTMEDHWKELMQQKDPAPIIREVLRLHQEAQKLWGTTDEQEDLIDCEDL